MRSWNNVSNSARGRAQFGFLIAAFGATITFSCSSKPPAEDLAPQAPAVTSFVPGEVLVKFKPAISVQEAQSSLASEGLQSVEYIAAIDVHRCRITSQDDVTTAIQRYRASSSVEYAEPNYIYRASKLPDDPMFGELWAMQNANDADIDAVEGWDIQTGSRDVLVAIIDTGIDSNHEDLRENMWRNPGESGDGKETNQIDDDGNGYVDDVFGWDFVSDDNDPSDDNSHGSHVAGTVAAIGNNGTGVTGVNWNASLMALKFLDRNGSGQASDAIEAIIYAARNGAQVLNNSWGGGGFSQALQDAIEFARGSNALFVAAAGNEGRDNDLVPSYPASYEVSNVLSVAASDRNDALSSFSNFGIGSVDLAAPGSEILSTTPGNKYQSFSGTSMATPHVSGVAALVLARYPGLSHRAVMVRLLGSVDVEPAFESTVASGGRLNAAWAMSTDPQVAFVTRLKDTSDTTGPYPVRAEATDDGSVIAAELVYGTSEATETGVAMSLSAPGVYAAAIPGQALGSGIHYFVEVTDDTGHKQRSRTFQFRIASDENRPQPCGNFALTLPGTGSSGARLWVAFFNVAILLFGILALRRFGIPSQSEGKVRFE